MAIKMKHFLNLRSTFELDLIGGYKLKLILQCGYCWFQGIYLKNIS